MNLSPQEIAELAEDCVSNNLTKDQVDFALKKANIVTGKIPSGTSNLDYYTKLIEYLDAHGELKDWLDKLGRDGVIFVKKWLDKPPLIKNNEVGPSLPIENSSNFITAFLSKICMPAAEEFGLLLRDKIANWRAKNLENMAKKAKTKLENRCQQIEETHAHPRLVSLIIEQSSWIDTDEIQEMWAGLLSSSCTKDGNDDSNLIFINLLSQLTALEVKILNYACQKAVKEIDELGLVTAIEFKTTKEELTEVCSIDDVYRIDRELDHLNALDLIEGTFGLGPEEEDEDNDETLQEVEVAPNEAYLSPTGLGINLYVRCQGTLWPPAKFFGLI